MPAYLIANIKVTDPVRFGEYRDKVAPMIARFGGRYLIRGGEVTPVEGDPRLERVVVLEFPSMEKLRAFYDSADYAPLIALRQSAAEGTVALVEGYAEPPVGPPEAAPVAAQYFNNRKLSIFGGSNEIQRNIISKMILGL